MNRVRLLIIGAGDVAHRDYLPEIHRLAGVAEIVAIASRTEARAKLAAERYGIPRWFTDYRAMLHEVDADAVVNLTPIPVHQEVVSDSLRAGKHVYTEKPLGLTAIDARALVEEAERRGLLLISAPALKLFPQVRWAAEVIASGRIGAVHCVHARAFGGVPPWAGYRSDPTPYFTDAVGPLLDMGVYPLHAILSLVGPIGRVMAMSSQTRDRFEIWLENGERAVVPVRCHDNWQLLLQCPGTTLASVDVNYCAHASAGPECEFRGEKGTIGIDLLDVAKPALLFSAEKGHWVEEAVPHERPRGPDHILGVKELVECILNHRAPMLDPRDAVHALEVIDAAKRSAAEGRMVDVRPVQPPTEGRP